MNDADFSREEMTSALFAQMVMQQTSMAMMLLGKMPHPQSGEIIRDLEAARLFIDQLEMLQDKTKGNLTKEEEALLKQSLMTLQMSFVEAAGEPQKPKPADSPAPEQKPAEPALKAAAATDEESQKRFVKKY